MTSSGRRRGGIPAGFTYLGQFVDHDLTDKTPVTLGDRVTPASSCRTGRRASTSTRSTVPVRRIQVGEVLRDDVHLKMGKTDAIGPDKARQGFDLPRGTSGTAKERRTAVIPDPRNDENLAVAQTHLAFIRFHNRVVDSLPSSVPAAQKFMRARRTVVKHYQWMLRHDLLPRICDGAVVRNVFDHGRKVFEVGATPTDVPTMPVEFSVAATASGTAWFGRVQLEQALRLQERLARPALRVLRAKRHPRGRTAAAEQLDRRLSPPLQLRRGRS